MRIGGLWVADERLQGVARRISTRATVGRRYGVIEALSFLGALCFSRGRGLRSRDTISEVRRYGAF